MNTTIETKKILVIDDEPDFVNLLETFLISEGYQVAHAYNGEEAMNLLPDFLPDIITLDIQMPKKSGILFYRQIKSTNTFQHIPVIVLTGLTHQDKDMENMIHSLLEAEDVPNPQCYLEKPVSKEILINTINATLCNT